jgi:anhydro-N-acetylmuramic acid kinase
MLPRADKQPELGVVGTMSGTSFDGVNAAFIRTNGIKVAHVGCGAYVEYKKSLRKSIQSLIEYPHAVDLELMLNTADELTRVHSQAVLEAVRANKLKPKNVNLVGFHGQSIYYNGNTRHTLQLGNWPLLQRLTGIKVIMDFRLHDIANGEAGAPLVPIYHKVLCANLRKPIAVLNIGGVANVTYLGAKKEIIAFDTGPGCALINDFMWARLKKPYDQNGQLACRGKIHEGIVHDFIKRHKFFSKNPPKALDRNQFASILKEIECLSTTDGLATLTYFSAACVIKSLSLLPQVPKLWLVCGGGRHNKFLMKLLANSLPAQSIDSFPLIDGACIDGDYVEAQAFGFLAARLFYGMAVR